MTSPKTYLPRAAESLLNAYPGSFQKWLAFHVIEEFFSLKSTAPERAALPAWRGGTNFPLTPNGELVYAPAEGTCRVSGSLVCLTCLLAVSNLPSITGYIQQTPKHFSEAA